MFPPSTKAHSDGSPIENLDKIPVLPDDLLMMIFDKLTTEERAPLGTVCKRFRELDFELGKKIFDNIYVEWGTGKQFIIGDSPNMKYALRGSAENPIEATQNTLRLFRNAKTRSMRIMHAKAACNNAESQLLLRFISNIIYEKITLKFYCDQDCSEIIIPALIQERILTNVNVNIFWRNKISRNIPIRKEMLLQLPRMKRLEMNTTGAFDASVDTDKGIVDDAIMCHLVSKIAEVSVMEVISNCTASGVLKAFEQFCKSPNEPTSVHFSVQAQFFDEIFEMAGTVYEKQDGWPCRYITDSKTRAVLRLYGYGRAYVDVAMFKTYP